MQIGRLGHRAKGSTKGSQHLFEGRFLLCVVVRVIVLLRGPLRSSNWIMIAHIPSLTSGLQRSRTHVQAVIVVITRRLNHPGTDRWSAVRRAGAPALVEQETNSAKRLIRLISTQKGPAVWRIGARFQVYGAN